MNDHGVPNVGQYRRLVNFLLSRILLFNARRGGECARMKVADVRSTVTVGTEDFDLSELEKQLCKRYEAS